MLFLFLENMAQSKEVCSEHSNYYQLSSASPNHTVFSFRKELLWYYKALFKGTKPDSLHNFLKLISLRILLSIGLSDAYK